MAYQQGSNKFASNNKNNNNTSRPASSATKKTGEKERAPISHYMVTGKDDKGESSLVEGVFISENQFGLTFYVAEGATVPAGRYFINKKKDKAANE
jgi:hypothetical protein